MKNFVIALIAVISLTTGTTFATSNKLPEKKEETQDVSTSTIKEPAEFQKVIDEYKDYVSKISPSIRDEVIAYRKEIAKINKEKRSLYKKLSQESQDYLKKEQEFKKRLPLNKKSLINTEMPAEKVENK